MKKLLLVFGLILSTGAIAQEINPSNLALKNACFSCHSMDKKSVGPSFKFISARYSKDTEALAKLSKSIKFGTKNNLGLASMPPMGSIVSDENIKIIGSWILSLE